MKIVNNIIKYKLFSELSPGDVFKINCSNQVRTYIKISNVPAGNSFCLSENYLTEVSSHSECAVLNCHLVIEGMQQ